MGPGGALPYVGGYQVPVNRPPFFTPILHPMTPFFYSVHIQWPPFFQFCIKFYIKSANFCALCTHFEKSNDFVAILTENLQILPWNCILHAEWPPFLWVHTKKGAHTKWPPFFLTKFYTECPYFRSPVGTCMSLSYSSAPQGKWAILEINAPPLAYIYIAWKCENTKVFKLLPEHKNFYFLLQNL